MGSRAAGAEGQQQRWREKGSAASGQKRLRLRVTRPRCGPPLLPLQVCTSPPAHPPSPLLTSHDFRRWIADRGLLQLRLLRGSRIALVALL